jgi:hypothetical protein
MMVLLPCKHGPRSCLQGELYRLEHFPSEGAICELSEACYTVLSSHYCRTYADLPFSLYPILCAGKNDRFFCGGSLG